jgi:uncharacterized membrane protein (GlpM family)
MASLLIQVIIPFVLSALIVVIITVIAERYGTKVGGLLGTLPSTIVVAFIFISLNTNVNFASKSVAVVPAEMGVNVFFLFFFTILIKRGLTTATVGALCIWSIISAIFYFYNLHDIYLSIIIYGILLGVAFLVLEKVMKIQSKGKVKVKYTPTKIAFRGLLAATVVTISVLLSNVGAVLSGIFSVFPAIFLSTMLITVSEHGSEFSGGMAKAMIIGTMSTVSYAVAIHFLYPVYDIIWGTVVAYGISIIFVVILLILRRRIQ